ncbi:MAG TPA: glycoside hydrolase domain-containing protein [Streptosporangiaceae bacterium]
MDVGKAWPSKVLAAVTVLAVAAVLVAVALPAPRNAAASTRGLAIGAAAASGTGLRQISYRGYEFQVPASWPVIDLSAHPTTCVRFDQHALYLGRPSGAQVCPSVLVGATEAMLVQPGAATPPNQSVDDPVARRITVTAPRIKLMASYQANRAEITAILESAGLPMPRPQSLAQAAETAAKTEPALLDSGAASGSGRGFDACTAPSSRAMGAWLTHSSYRAIGIYIGGSDRACAQPNLTAAWVSDQAAAGWHFIPLYVGPQVAFGREVTAPRDQAVASAKDAAVRARALGFGPGTPLYYDMEAYLPRRSRAALTFFTAWTSELHSRGYRSGIYSSSGSGIRDLVGKFQSSSYQMPDIIYDALWNGAADTEDPAVPATYWANHQRVHQFSGGTNESHGGYRINIDRDYLDVRLGPAVVSSGSRQASQAAVAARGVVQAFYQGTDGALWYSARRNGHWSRSASLGGSLTSQPSAVATGSGGVDVFYRAGGGGLHHRTWRNAKWSPERSLAMGMLGGAPKAVSTARGQIEVFWRGADRAQLWNAQFTPGAGWQGPNLIATGLASAPAPTVSGRGTFSVFWKGADRRLWRTSLAASTWAAPTAVADVKLRTWPRAAGLRDGEIDVFWGGASHRVWRLTRTRSRGWSAPARAGSDFVGTPFVVSSSAGTNTAFWRGREGSLWHARSQGTTGWTDSAPLSIGSVGRGLFAVGQPGGILDVFWRGPGDGHLWHDRFSPRTSSWTRPNSLGGSVRGLAAGNEQARSRQEVGAQYATMPAPGTQSR